MKLAHFVLPHPKTNKKAHLLSEKTLLIYALFFITLQFGFHGIAKAQPGVLGTTSAITSQQIITLTNEQRQKYGDTLLKENNKLDKAAEEKAKNMFQYNYWAHVNPVTGQTPWVWFQDTGYNYEYAGENLARGFSNSNDVVAAWMASKMGHRENLLGKNYQEIGVAVEDGILNGEKTTLVVQVFGTPAEAVTDSSVGEGGAQAVSDNNITTNVPNSEVPVANSEVNSANPESTPQPSILSKFITIDPTSTTKTIGLVLLALLVFLGTVDLYVINRRKKAYVQLHTRHLPHATFIAVIIIGLLIMHAGSII